MRGPGHDDTLRVHDGNGDEGRVAPVRHNGPPITRARPIDDRVDGRAGAGDV